MEELKVQLAAVEQQLADEKAKGAERNNALISDLEHKQAEILLMMDEAAKKAEVQAAVQTNQTEMADSLTNIDLGDGETASMYDYTTTPEAADLLMAYINDRVAVITEKAEIQAQAYKQELQAAQQKISDAEARATVAEQESSQKDLTIADLESKRDAAAAQITEKDEEIARLSKENAELRDNVVKPTATNITANLKELADKAKAARPKIYDVKWHDEPRRTQYIAKLAATGEDIVFKRLELGKYNVITEEEALQFRTSQPSENEPAQTEPVQTDVTPDIPLDNGVDSPPSPPEVPNNDNTVEEHPVHGEVAPETGSLEDRVSALEARIATLEANRVGIVA